MAASLADWLTSLQQHSIARTRIEHGEEGGRSFKNPSCSVIRVKMQQPIGFSLSRARVSFLSNRWASYCTTNGAVEMHLDWHCGERKRAAFEDFWGWAGWLGKGTQGAAGGWSEQAEGRGSLLVQ